MSANEHISGDHSTALLQASFARVESKIRRRLLGKLWTIQRGSYDIDDVLSSAQRRLLVAGEEGRLPTRNRHQLEAYIWRTTLHVALEAIRRDRRDHRLRSVLQVEEAHPVPVVARNDRERIATMLSTLRPEDRQVLESWGRGMPHERIAQETGLSLVAHRSRWRRLLRRVRHSLG